MPSVQMATHQMVPCVARGGLAEHSVLLAMLAGSWLLAARTCYDGADEVPVWHDRRSATQKFVYIGTYVNQINSMSLKDEKVQVDFHIWFRWKGDDLKPLETFDLTNGDVDAKEDIYQATSGGFHYAVCRCLATIQKQWNVRDFPLDNHDITIELEDADQEEEKLSSTFPIQRELQSSVPTLGFRAGIFHGGRCGHGAELRTARTPTSATSICPREMSRTGRVTSTRST